MFQASLLDSMPTAPHAPLQLPASASKPYEGAAADVFTCGVLLYRLLVGPQATWSCCHILREPAQQQDLEPTLLPAACTSRSEQTLVLPGPDTSSLLSKLHDQACPIA